MGCSCVSLENFQKKYWIRPVKNRRYGPAREAPQGRSHADPEGIDSSSRICGIVSGPVRTWSRGICHPDDAPCGKKLSGALVPISEGTGAGGGGALDLKPSLKFEYMKHYQPLVRYEEEEQAVADNLDTFPVLEWQEISPLTEHQRSMMRLPFLGAYLFNWHDHERKAVELLEQNLPLRKS